MSTTKNKNIKNYDEELDKQYGKQGTYERMMFDCASLIFYYGTLLSEARKKSKISVATLAKKTGIDIEELKKFENGDNCNINIQNFIAILKVLGLKLDINREI